MSLNEVKEVMNEIINRIILDQDCFIEFHPDFDPLKTALSIQPSKKRLREINDEYFNPKKHKSNHPLTGIVPEKELDMWKSERNDYIGMTTWKNENGDFINIFDSGDISVCKTSRIIL